MSTYLWLLAIVVGVHPLDATRKGPVPALPGIASRQGSPAAPGGHGGSGTEEEKAPPASAGTETGEEALSRASRARRESYGKEGEEKYQILERAAQEYEGVTRSHAGEVQVVAEAWFRAGEIYRGLRRVEEAQRCFQAAVALVKAPEYAARAMNELGHLERRQKNHAAAIAFYRRVRTEFPGERQEGVRALTWEGKVLLEQERIDEGTQLLLQTRETYPEFPVEDIRNTDLVAATWIENERGPEALELVNACMLRHQVPPEGSAEVPAEVRKALERMRSRELLERQDAALAEE